MIIINEYTETALTERLETIQQEAANGRCIYFKFAATDIPSDSITPTIQNYIETYIETTEQHQLYVCEDGDVYFIADNIVAKDMQLFVTHIGDALKIDMDNTATIYELPTQVYPILTSVDEKIQRKNAKQENAKLTAKEMREQQKRNAILEVVNEENAKTTIINTRNNRIKPQIMVIEDDSFTRQLVVNIMKKQYQITGVSNPANALSTYVKLAPDILFLDINLPDVTGHELLERIIELDPDAYVVMLSGNADKHNITTAMNKGAKGFVGKPFTKDKLLQYIDKRLNNK